MRLPQHPCSKDSVQCPCPPAIPTFPLTEPLPRPVVTRDYSLTVPHKSTRFYLLLVNFSDFDHILAPL